MSTRTRGRAGPGRRTLWLSAAALVVVVSVLAWLLLEGRDEDTAADRDPETAPPTSSVLPTPSVDASGSPLPERPSGATDPSPAASGTPQETIRADIDEPAEVSEDISVRLRGFESVQGEARGPGETSGPAIRFDVEVSNGTSEPLDLLAVVVTAYYGRDRVPAGDLSGPGARDLPLEVEPDGVGTGTFVFAVPRNQRDLVRVEFSYGAEAPRVLFTGPVG